MFESTFEKSLASASSAPLVEWTKTYGGLGNDGAYSVIQTGDGGYALAGFETLTGNNQDYWLTKTDASGTIQWNRTYGGNGIDDAYSVIQTSDGGYAMAGFTNSSGAGSYDGWLVKVDSSGNMQWNHTYGGPSADDLYTVIQTDDNSYVLAGYTTSAGAGAADGQLIKVDSQGNLLWNQTYGGTGVDDIATVIKTNDGGYALVGYTSSYGAGGTDFWLSKSRVRRNLAVEQDIRRTRRRFSTRDSPNARWRIRSCGQHLLLRSRRQRFLAGKS